MQNFTFLVVQKSSPLIALIQVGGGEVVASRSTVRRSHLAMCLKSIEGDKIFEKISGVNPPVCLSFGSLGSVSWESNTAPNSSTVKVYFAKVSVRIVFL